MLGEEPIGYFFALPDPVTGFVPGIGIFGRAYIAMKRFQRGDDIARALRVGGLVFGAEVDTDRQVGQPLPG